MKFKLNSEFSPTGDQPQAISQLSQGIKKGQADQVLLGVTGSGKTFSMASVIEKVQKPTLVIAHNKTLAAQLYQEFRDFFPENAVSYFVSYYDYYQPEAYIPTTDTYIEKETQINDEIDKLRLSTTTNLLTRQDVIVVASVSCIYNLGSPVEYGQFILQIMPGQILQRRDLLLRLSQLQYERSKTDLRRGTYRLRGDTIQLWPAYEDKAVRIETLENKITQINWIDPISGEILSRSELTTKEQQQKSFVIYPAKHYVINPKSEREAFKEILIDLKKRIKVFEAAGQTYEAHRIKQRVKYDLEMMREFGFVGGIENYSRYFDGRQPGEPPFSLLDYFQKNVADFGGDSFLTIIDESHMTVPQIRGMYAGDQARKQTLVDYGFRLPSALDNRPLRFNEFLDKTQQRVYTSATPKDWERKQVGGEIVEQLIRPTGLLDPEVEIRPVENQIEDLVKEIIKRKRVGQRVLVTTLTKKMAEALTDYLNDKQKIKELAEKNPVFPKVAYLHSDIETMERSDILASLRQGEYDVVVGINLLREGLDLPEVTLVAILDADQAGFLRSRVSLIQTMGRAARHVEGKAILYADRQTEAIKAALEETQRRRATQIKYNQKHNITPQTISKPIRERMLEKKEESKGYQLRDEGRFKYGQPIDVTLGKEKIDLNAIQPEALTPADKEKLTKKLTRRMKQAANEMDFELAALIRDKVITLEE